MPGQLRDIKDLQDELDAAGPRGVTKQDLLDALQSQAKVGGSFSINAGAAPDEQLTLAGGWNRIDCWQRSIDTQGVQDGLQDADGAKGRYRIANAAAGDYTVDAFLRFTPDTDGTYEIRFAVDDGAGNMTTSPYHDAVTTTAGTEALLIVNNGVIKGLGGNQYLQLEIRGPTGANLIISYGQWGCQR